MSVTLTAEQVRRARMSSLLLDAPEHRTPLEVTRWFGAMQAQDVASAHWSLGVRCADSTDADIVAAFERRELVRTWPMRGTIHVIPAEDASWMLATTGVRVMGGAAGRRERLGLSLDDAESAAAALRDALAGGHTLTRAECLSVITDAGIDPAGQRGYHLLWFAAQMGVTCIGPQRGSDQTFALLADWAPRQVERTREEAVIELLHRYVRSHGPVPLTDFTGWTTLPMRDARAAAEASAGRLVRVATEAGEMWSLPDIVEVATSARPDAHPIVALPGFDEFVLGYKDRALHIPPGGMERIVPGGNGIFRATVVIDGTAVATWSRTLRGDQVRVSVDPLASLPARRHAAVERAFERYAAFLDRRLHLSFVG